jgi:bacillolysin
MKRFLLFLAFTAPVFPMYGQNHGFKTIHKNPAGTVKPNLNFKQTGNNQLKSTAPFRYVTTKALAFPGFNQTDKPKVIRKGNSPIFIEKSITPLKSATVSAPEDRFYNFLEESKEITRIDNPRGSFKISGVHTDNLGITHVKALQQYKGIEIYGSESILHLDAQKERFTGSFQIVSREVPTTPRINIEQALQNAGTDLQKLTVYRSLSPKEKQFLHYEAPEYSLVICDKGRKEYALTWEITIRPNFVEEWKYFVNATDGEIIRKYNNTNSDGPATGSGVDLNSQNRTFDIYLENGQYFLYNTAENMYNSSTGEGVILTLDANGTSTADLNYSYVTSASTVFSNKAAAISAHCNAALTYEYFYNTFGRNSINNQKGDIISLVNVTEDDGSSMENAFWNGQAAFYGNGGTSFKSLAGALDVTAHELGHGVVSNTANLEYTGQSGAMNESYADIFGSMVDRNDWLIGEDITRTSFSPSGALRDMANPHNQGDKTKAYWQPAHVSEMYLGTQDNGGVHINSGIGNHAYYLFATSTSKEIAEKVFYRALTEYLTKTSQFIDWRIAVIQAAKDLYGPSSQEAVKAGDAFTAVGIQEEVVVEDTPDYEANPGQEYLLSYDISSADPVTLYRSSVTGTNFAELSSTVMKGKVSVTDDGSAGVFVATDDKIKVISLDPADPNEDYLSDEAFFDNVTVSKDGNRLAAISTEEDASIYVYDFISQTWNTFTLYNPTTSDAGINAGGVRFADAIEFDITGEYLIYDACNVLNSNSLEDINYWDIGFIKVWDNTTGDFADGSISKLFSSLPDNTSVGNPVFSKNSPYIIAFDYFYDDGVNQDYAVYGADLETGDLGLIYANNTLGYPAFSTSDDKIAFTTLYDTDNHEIVATVSLDASKIAPSGNPAAIINYARWPVYYATGDRTLGLAPVANFTADYKTGGTPLAVKFIDQSSNNPTSWQWTFQGGTPSSSTLQNPEVTYNITGTYKVVLKATNSIGNNTITKNGYIVVTNATSLDDTENKLILLYPNPVDDILNIGYDKDFSVKIYNLQGDLQFTAENQARIDLTKLKSGIYILQLDTEKGTFRHKLVKQ